MVKQLAVGRIGRLSGHQLVDRAAQSFRRRSRLGRGQLAGIAGGTNRKGLLEDAPDGMRGLGLPTLGVGHQLADPAQQVATQLWWAAWVNLR
jgi:hypothetical protein